MTNPSKLEQVARAIMCARPESDGVCLVTNWQAEAECNPHVATALSQARAAIAAMELPTDEMLRAGDSCYSPESVWFSMISAALKEEK